MRRIIPALTFALAATAILFSKAFAFDFANREVIGFSEDGKLFAFEQFGIQDGSGFPYSEIFIIETQSDEWAVKPIRVRIDNEDATVKQARDQAHAMAKPHLVEITQTPIFAATHQADQTLKDPYRLSITPKSFFLPRGQSRMDFHIETLPLGGNETCESFGGDIVGFRLTRTTAESTPLVMHEDLKVPESRACPLDYHPADILVHITPEGQFFVAVLVRVERVGFEGSDRRYLAVTGALN